MATMMVRALKKARVDTSNIVKEKFKDDNEISSLAKESAYYMSNIRIIKGMGKNKFGVKDNATKEQSLLISLRSINEFEYEYMIN